MSIIVIILIALVVIFLLNTNENVGGYRWPGNIVVTILAIVLILWLLGYIHR